MLAEILQLAHEINSLPLVSYKKGGQKSFSKFRGKHKKQSSVVFFQEVVPKNFPKFAGKCLCWRPEGLQRYWRSSKGVPVLCEFCEIFRSFLQKTSGWPLLTWPLFLQINDVSNLKQFIWWSNAILEKGIQKPVPFRAVMEIRLDLTYLAVISTHSKKKKMITFIIYKD